MAAHAGTHATYMLPPKPCWSESTLAVFGESYRQWDKGGYLLLLE